MFEFPDQDFSAKAVIKVIGIGGAGGNVTDDVAKEVKDVEYIRANTDAQALNNSAIGTAFQLGEELTRGLGAGANPEIGRGAAEENREKIHEVLQGADMVFITAGMGGGTGTGAAPVFAEIARDLGILTVAVVTKPFAFEGPRRMKAARSGINELTKHVDSLITIPNDKLLTVLGKNASLVSAFKEANGILKGAVKGIADLITMPGLINVDFADVRTVMSEKGMAMMGSGEASGDDRAQVAAEAAISSPLLEDVNLQGAKGVLVNVTGGIDMSIGEFEVVGDTIRAFTSEEATVVVGTVIDSDMSDSIRVTVVVTGLGDVDSVKPRVDTPQASQVVTEQESVPSNVAKTTVAKVSSSTTSTATNIAGVNYDSLQASPILRQEKQDDKKEANFDDEELLNVPAFLRRQDDQEDVY